MIASEPKPQNDMEAGFVGDEKKEEEYEQQQQQQQRVIIIIIKKWRTERTMKKQ